MDWIEFKAAIRNCNEDLIWQELCKLRSTCADLLVALQDQVEAHTLLLRLSGYDEPAVLDCTAHARAAIAKAGGAS